MMQSVRNSYPVYGQTETTDINMSVCSLSSLWQAENRCHRGVGYKNSVSRFHMLKLSKIYELQKELLFDTYKPTLGDSFPIYEPKYRMVTATRYRDRIPQASYCVNYLYKNQLTTIANSNMACVKGRGVDKARERLKQILRNSSSTEYVLKCDIKNYFGSINHDILVREITNQNDKWELNYHRQSINVNGEQVGLPLGSEINQLSAILFLNKLDHLLGDRYVRYMDDFVLIGNKSELIDKLNLIKQELSRLHLQLSDRKTYFQPISRPISFLGFTFLRHPTGRVTMKRKRNRVHELRRRLKRIIRTGIDNHAINDHVTCERSVMKKSTRSDYMKYCKYSNLILKGVTQ